MEIAETIECVRALVKAAREKGGTIGLVPTMGALHAGHASLINAAVADGHLVVVSIFVNPTQFGQGEDFNKYPRPIEADLQICREHKVDVVFVPTAEQMYGGATLTWVNVEKITDPLCGQFRPGHFRGVTTICAKLFNIVGPDVAYFGQKDAQQAIVVKRMVADLNMPLKIVVCPTVREPDGLAMSSRNRYLTDRQRRDAACIYRALQQAQKMVASGVTDCPEIIAGMRDIISKTPSATKIEYINIVDPDTLESVKKITGGVLIAAAVRFGSTRLIDNILLDASRPTHI